MLFGLIKNKASENSEMIAYEVVTASDKHLFQANCAFFAQRGFIPVGSMQVIPDPNNQGGTKRFDYFQLFQLRK